jgi:hypothetical protein
MFLLAGCMAPESERLSCNDTLPPEQASFSSLTALVLDPLKGCTATGCHAADTQQQGVRLDQPELIYDEFSMRPGDYYALLASGQMPEDGVRWSEDDLRLFRSWYCNGAFPP